MRDSWYPVIAVLNTTSAVFSVGFLEPKGVPVKMVPSASARRACVGLAGLLLTGDTVGQRGVI